MASADEKIKTDVVSHLTWDSRVDASKIKVEVNAGIVKLEGSVPSTSTAMAAVDAAEAVAGVTDVINAMRIETPMPASLPRDGDLKVAISNMIAANPDIDPSRIAVIVQKGRVTLDGSVDAYWKKGFLETVVSLMGGVADIESRLSVVPTKATADQATADDIVAALDRHALIDAGNITVTVKDGCVILSGTVPTAPARKAAGLVAAYTFGVIDVHNELDVHIT
jgi:osmotically-inducible protein OsmY